MTSSSSRPHGGWEDAAREWEENPGRNDWQDCERDDSDGIDYGSIVGESAGAELSELLVDAKMSGRPISAKLCCLIAHWATQAGAVGEVTKLAVPPGQQSGKYSGKFDKVIGKPRDQGYHYVPVPQILRSSGSRKVAEMSAVLPHEVLAAHVHERGQELRELLAVSELPRCYYSHPVVERETCNRLVVPVAYYLDGVKYSRENSVLGCWLVCLLTKKRWLLWTLRKASACNCGCRGWCSLYTLMLLTSQCTDALSEGRGMTDAVGGLDAERRSGAALDFCGAVLFWKGD